MGLITKTARSLRFGTKGLAATVPVWQSGLAQFPNLNYETYAREGYMKNELVFACIDALATSAAEPRLCGKRGHGAKAETIEKHPLLDILENPNNWMTPFQMWSTVQMHLGIAGNSYLIKERSASQRLRELWIVTRPDDMRVVPDRNKFIAAYDYRVGTEVYRLAPSDVIHFKTRHPLDRFYGMPPLMAASGRTDIDNFMKDFVKSFFQNAGVPAGLLSIKEGNLGEDEKREIKHRFRNEFGGPRSWHELMVLNADATYTPMTMQLGQRGLVVPELDQIAETRICQVFGVPPAIVGALSGLNTSSYANLRMVQTFFWDNTLAPIYKNLAQTLTRGLKDELGDLNRLEFDMSDVQALQEDQTAINERVLRAYQGGLMPLETAQNRLGMEQDERGGVYLVPANMVPTQDWALAPRPKPAEGEEPEEEPPEPELVAASRNGSMAP